MWPESVMQVPRQHRRGLWWLLKPRALLLPPPPRLGASSAGAATLRRCPSRRRRKRRPEFPHRERPWLEAGRAPGGKSRLRFQDWALVFVVVSLKTAAALMESWSSDVTGNSYTTKLPGRIIIRGWRMRTLLAWQLTDNNDTWYLYSCVNPGGSILIFL